MYLSDNFSQSCYDSIDTLFDLGEIPATEIALFTDANRKAKYFYDTIRQRENEQIPLTDLTKNGLTQDEALKLILVLIVKFGGTQIFFSLEEGQWFLTCSFNRYSL